VPVFSVVYTGWMEAECLPRHDAKRDVRPLQTS